MRDKDNVFTSCVIEIKKKREIYMCIVKQTDRAAHVGFFVSPPIFVHSFWCLQYPAAATSFPYTCIVQSPSVYQVKSILK